MKPETQFANFAAATRSRMNFPDRVYTCWFAVLTVALLFAPDSRHYWRFLALNVAILATIAIAAWRSEGSVAWRIVHDWYPILLMIVGFEAVSRLSLVFVPHWQDAILLKLESRFFAQPPTLWLAQFRHPVVAELLEFGYFSFYWMLPAVGIVLYGRAWEKDAEELRPFCFWMAALAVGYALFFTTYLLFPTEGPAHTIAPHASSISGPFRWLVLLIQHHSGVHGNAFPSAHLMAATVSVLAAIRWAPRFGWWLVPSLVLMGLGAVYDGYHYASDVLAGLLLGAGVFWAAVRLLGRRAHGVN